MCCCCCCFVCLFFTACLFGCLFVVCVCFFGGVGRWGGSRICFSKIKWTHIFSLAIFANSTQHMSILSKTATGEQESHEDRSHYYEIQRGTSFTKCVMTVQVWLCHNAFSLCKPCWSWSCLLCTTQHHYNAPDRTEVSPIPKHARQYCYNDGNRYRKKVWRKGYCQ